MDGLKQSGCITFMINFYKKLQHDIVNNQNKLSDNHFAYKLFRIFFAGMSADCILCGIIPGFISFQRIFYTKDSYVFFILYITLLSFLFINIIGYLIISWTYKLFLKKLTVFLIPIGYLLILGLLSLNAYLFTEFNLTETGYEVPFNIFLYIIDLFVIFPSYVIYEYNLIQLVTKKLRK